MKLREVKERSVADLNIEYKGGSFDCSIKDLTSLSGSPVEIDNHFYCYANQLTSLVGGPVHVGGNFDCSANRLTSLEGGPVVVGGYYECGKNNLTSLKGAPSFVPSEFICSSNKLTSLEGAPSFIDGDFYCNGNFLTSLKNVHHIIKHINGRFTCSNNQIKQDLVYILLIKGVTAVSTDDPAFNVAANEYLQHNPSGSMKAMLDVLHMMED